MPTYDYTSVIVPGVFAAIVSAIDQQSRKGWRFVGQFPALVPIPEAPADLRGESDGAILLGQAQQAAQKTMPGYYLIFERPTPAEAG